MFGRIKRMHPDVVGRRGGIAYDFDELYDEQLNLKLSLPSQAQLRGALGGFVTAL